MGLRAQNNKKILPMASGPSESRLLAQQMITRELLRKQTVSKGVECASSKIVGTAIKKEEKPKTIIKMELAATDVKRIKVEASEVHMTKRFNPDDAKKTWREVHPSGSPCGLRHAIRGSLRRHELPDLISTDTSVPSQPLTDANSHQPIMDQSMLMVPPSLLGKPPSAAVVPPRVTGATCVSTARLESPALVHVTRSKDPLLTVRTARVTTSISSLLQSNKKRTCTISTPHETTETQLDLPPRQINTSQLSTDNPKASCKPTVSTSRDSNALIAIDNESQNVIMKIVSTPQDEETLKSDSNALIATNNESQKDTMKTVSTPQDGEILKSTENALEKPPKEQNISCIILKCTC